METIREKVLRAWQDKVKIEVRHGEDILTGRVISYCVDSFIFQTDGKALRFGYEAVSEISFFSEPAERITPDVAKERWWWNKDCDGGDKIFDDNSLPIFFRAHHTTDAQMCAAVNAPQMLDVLEDMELYITNTEGAYPEGNMMLMLHENILERIGAVIKKARGGE